MTEINSASGSKQVLSKNQILGLGILSLILVVVLFAFLNRPTEGLQEGKIVLTAGDNKLAVLTLDDLKKLPAVQKKMTIHTSRGNEEHEYTMTSLLDVLNGADPKLTAGYARIVTKGIDNYTSGVNMAEVLEPDNVYIAYLDHSQLLKTKSGQDGSLQIVICNDPNGQRFTKFLVSIDLQN
ncbi:MAG TPA: hypothetical protein VN456_08700 [Desulfosporosinus sp.]|nr:hypothetical protein [Desulfosporosinus sp.]